MITKTKNNIALLLMSSSLLLLGIFLSFWIHSLYNQEISRLKEKSSFIFINSIRNAEAKFFKEDILFPFWGFTKKENDSLEITSIQMDIHTEKPLVDGAVLTIQDTQICNLQNSVGIKVILNEQDFNNDENTGALISFLMKNSNKNITNSLSVSYKDSIILHSIKNIVTQSSKAKDLPEEFRIIKILDSLANFKSVLSESYKDLESGDRFALEVENFGGYVFKKMLPQILFSILLFSITMLAFFFIYKNLKEQQQLTALKNELISNITHELKTPIATVGVAIEALQNFGALEDPKRTQEYLDISKQELNRLSILVDKVLNTSLFEKSDFELKSEEINLKELIQAVLNSMKLQFSNREAIVDFTTLGNNFLFKGDRIHLTSVIYNLIDNALKYSPLTPRILINLEENTEQLGFSIQDNGLGIRKEYMDKIFEKFFRIPSGNAHNIKGHGLGLSYVKNVIEKHHGNIEVQSEEGKGTFFKVTFPI